MNVARARIVLRPRATGELLDLACLIVGKHALKLYLWLTALVLLPAFATVLTLHYVAELDLVVLWLIAFTLSSLGQGVFTIAAGRWLFAEDLRARDVLRMFASRVVSFTFAWATRFVLLVLSSIGLVAPAAVATIYLFTPEASLLEMAGPLDALGRSRNFTRFDFGRAFVMWLALVALTTTVTTLVAVLCEGLVADVLQLGHPFESLFDDGFSPYVALGLMLSAPYAATARFLMYIDGRTRGDGWDIQVRFMAIAQEREDQALPTRREAA